ncbi:MAG: type II toxin-antitoxin system RelE/ParE family toxin [Steroidobacteraceae bacterium]
MRVNWSDKAKTRLREIQRTIAKDAPERADAMVERLLDRVGNLGEHPHIGRQVPEYEQSDLREVLERPYRIIYQIGDERIDILTVKHYRQRLPTHLADL